MSIGAGTLVHTNESMSLPLLVFGRQMEWHGHLGVLPINRKSFAQRHRRLKCTRKVRPDSSHLHEQSGRRSTGFIGCVISLFLE